MGCDDRAPNCPPLAKQLLHLTALKPSPGTYTPIPRVIPNCFTCLQLLYGQALYFDIHTKKPGGGGAPTVKKRASNAAGTRWEFCLQRVKCRGRGRQSPGPWARCRPPRSN